jgi:hypothetical protein
VDISSLATLYVDVPVVAPAGVTITSDVVQVAFLRSGKPGVGDWLAAAWATNTSGQTVARILVGPGGLVLASGDWYEWVKVTDTPEVPVFLAGKVTVT